MGEEMLCDLFGAYGYNVITGNTAVMPFIDDVNRASTENAINDILENQSEEEGYGEDIQAERKGIFKLSDSDVDIRNDIVNDLVKEGASDPLTEAVSDFYKDKKNKQKSSVVFNNIQSMSAEDIINHPINQRMNDIEQIETEKGRTDYINTAEREELRKKIIEDELSKGSARLEEDGKYVYNGDVKEEFKLFIIIGPSSAGKSTISDRLSLLTGSRIPDSDSAKKGIPEYNNGFGASRVHPESKIINNRILQEICCKNSEGEYGIHHGENVIIPVIGDNAQKLIDNYINKFKDSGYDIYVILNDLSIEKAVQRAFNRNITKEQYVNISDVIYPQQNKPIQAFYELLEKSNRGEINGIKGFAHFDNDVEQGQLPIIRGEYYRRGDAEEIYSGMAGNDAQEDSRNIRGCGSPGGRIVQELGLTRTKEYLEQYAPSMAAETGGRFYAVKSEESDNNSGDFDYSDRAVTAGESPAPSRSAVVLNRANALYEMGVTPVEYYESSSDEYDPAVAAQLRGMMLRNGQRAGGKLSDTELEENVLEHLTHYKKQGAKGVMAFESPARIFDQLGQYHDTKLKDPAQYSKAVALNLNAADWYNKNYTGYLQSAIRMKNQFMEQTTNAVANIQANDAEAILAQLVGEQVIPGEAAAQSVSDGKHILIPLGDGAMVLDKNGKIRYMADGSSLVTYSDKVLEQNARLKREINKIRNDGLPDADQRILKLREQEAGPIQTQGRTVLQRSEDGVFSLVDEDGKTIFSMRGKPAYSDKVQQLSNTLSGIYSDMHKANLVFDITYVTDHVDIVIPALELGCDVFSEKPMAFKPEESVKMVKAAERTGKHYFVLQNRRYNKYMRAMREVISSGAIGVPGYVCADIFTSGDLRSIRNKLEKPMMMDNAVHTFDQARFLTGMDAISVIAESLNPEGTIYSGDSAGVCVFRMGKNTVFDYRCWLGVEGCHTSWESQWRIIGSKGTMIWDGYENLYYEVPDYDYIEGKGNPFVERRYKRIIPEYNWHGLYSHKGSIDEMFSAIEEGRDAETDCKDNIKSMMMVFAALESAETGRRIIMNDYINKYMVEK